MLPSPPTPAQRRAARAAVSGLRLGDLVLEPQDVEVADRAHLRDYFHTRDVTMNEAVLLVAAGCGEGKGGEGKGEGGEGGGGGGGGERGPQDGGVNGGGERGQNDSGGVANGGGGARRVLLFYTRQALQDVRAGLIRPSVHVLRTKLATYWAADPDTGEPYTAPAYVTRCVIRYLKGHGGDYALDAATWRHYRRRGLGRVALFKARGGRAPRKGAGGAQGCKGLARAQGCKGAAAQGRTGPGGARKRPWTPFPPSPSTSSAPSPAPHAGAAALPPRRPAPAGGVLPPRVRRPAGARRRGAGRRHQQALGPAAQGGRGGGWRGGAGGSGGVQGPGPPRSPCRPGGPRRRRGARHPAGGPPAPPTRLPRKARVRLLKPPTTFAKRAAAGRRSTTRYRPLAGA
jgi:hypothetical protein